MLLASRMYLITIPLFDSMKLGRLCHLEAIDGCTNTRSKVIVIKGLSVTKNVSYYSTLSQKLYLSFTQHSCSIHHKWALCVEQAFVIEIN